MEERINEADDVAILVDHRDVNGVLVLGSIERRHRLDRLGEIDLRGKFISELVGQQIIDRHVRDRHIRDERITRRIGQPRRFDFDVEIVHVQWTGLHLEARQDVEDHQRDDALPVRRAFVDRSSAEVRRDRRDIFACGCGEIFLRMQPADALQIAHHVVGDIAAIECIRAFAADQFHRCGQFRLILDVADGRRLIVRARKIRRDDGSAFKRSSWLPMSEDTRGVMG